MRHSNVSPRFEHHHGYWATWESIADDKLCNDIQPNLLIRDSLDHPNGNHIEERNDKGQNEVLPMEMMNWIENKRSDGEDSHRELCIPDLDGYHTEGEHGHWSHFINNIL